MQGAKTYKEWRAKYQRKVNAKNRRRIHNIVLTAIVLFIVVSFIGLVIGLSLGLKTSNQCDNLNCGNSSDPCLANPCSSGACTYVCPKLYLDPPAANVLDQFSNTTFVVAPTLTLASLYPITGATVAIVSSLSNGTLSVTDYPGISQSFNPTSGVLTLNTTASGVSVATYQAALRSLAYSNAPLAGDTDIQCSQYHVGLNYLVTNSNRTMPKAAVADVYLNLQQVSSSS